MSYIENEYKEATKYEMKKPDIGEIEAKITTEGLTPHERRVLGKEAVKAKMRIAECNEPVAENIQRIIKNKGLKQIVVAEKIEVAANDFSRMLKGRKLIKVCDIKKIANALEVDVNELFVKRDEVI